MTPSKFLNLALLLALAAPLAAAKPASPKPAAAQPEAEPAQEAAATPAPTPAPTAEAKPAELRFSGLVVGDYYDVASHHDGRFNGLNGTVLRRVWLTADKDLGKGFSARLRYEINEDDFSKSSGPMTPYLKDAWVSWAWAEKQKASLGLIESGTVGYLEKQWGLRTVEKTPLDLQGLEVTRDQGLSLEGGLGGFTYAAVYGNGNSTKSQGADNGKKGALALGWNGPAGFSVWTSGSLKAAADGVASPEPYTYVLQAFLGWKSEAARAGLLYARRVTVTPATADEGVKELISAYVVAKVWGHASAYARVDHLLWNTVDVGAESYLQLAQQRSTLAILGLDYPITPNLNLQPNVELAYYQDDKGGAVKTQDVIPRLTFAWTF